MQYLSVLTQASCYSCARTDCRWSRDGKLGPATISHAINNTMNFLLYYGESIVQVKS